MNKIIRLSMPLVAVLSALITGSHLVNASVSLTQAGSAGASTLLVTTLEDELNQDGDCSLREAIEAANTNLNVDACGTGTVLTDTITFALPGTTTVTSELAISAGGPLVIDGNGKVICDGASSTRIFLVEAGAELTLNNLSITNGSTTSNGGGIYNSGSLVIKHCTISGNQTWGEAGHGGGIFNSGELLMIDSTLSLNISWKDRGGGIYNMGTLSLAYSDVLSNTAYHDGGGIYQEQGTLTLEHVNASNNIAEFSGGGINIYTGTITITSSLLTNNQALYGAGVNNQSGVLSIKNSTLSNNYAEYDGGGLYDQGTTSIVNSTLAYNAAGYFGGGLRSNIPITIINSIIAHNVGSDCYVMAVEGGHNISSDDTCQFDPANSSMFNTDPRLGVLQDNGGPTRTFALLVDSPAIDAGDNTQCLHIDQRNIPRPQDGNRDGSLVCDIGAYELLPWQIFLPMSVK